MAQIVGWKDIQYSEAAEKALSELKKGQLLAVQMKHVSNGKIQVEFAERIDAPNATNNLLGLFNKSDERFSNRGPRRMWLTTQPQDLKELLGLELAADTPHADILTVVTDIKGFKPALQITEVIESQLSESQQMSKNYDVKRAGKDGNFFYCEATGERVFQYIDLVGLAPGQEVNHSYIKGAFKPATNVISSAINSAQSAMTGAADGPRI